MSVEGRYLYPPSVNISCHTGSRGKDLQTLLLRHVQASRMRADREIPVFHVTAAQYQDIFEYFADLPSQPSVGDAIYGLPLSRLAIIDNFAGIVPDVERCVDIDAKVAEYEAAHPLKCDAR